MVGIQHAYRERDRLDRAALAALRTLVPDPAPDSVFVPIQLEPPWPPRAYKFEGQFWTIFNSGWSSGPALRLAYGRGDLHCGYASWRSTAWRNPTRDNVRVDGVKTRTAWEQLIPFELDARNEVRLITSVQLTMPTGEHATISIPQTTALASQGRIPWNIWTFPAPPATKAEPPPPPADRR